MKITTNTVLYVLLLVAVLYCCGQSLYIIGNEVLFDFQQTAIVSALLKTCLMVIIALGFYVIIKVNIANQTHE